MKFIKLGFLIGLLATNKLLGQITPNVNYQFQADSISGFNEFEASARAAANGCRGEEYSCFLHKAKRSFVKQKYHLVDMVPLKIRHSKDLTGYRTDSLSIPCNNDDFEMALTQANDSVAIQGWSVSSGLNNGGCSMPIYNTSSNFTVYSSPVFDPLLGVTVSSYFDSNSSNVPSGSCFVKVNNENGGGSVTTLSKTFMIGSSDTLFHFAFTAAVEDGSHACCDQSGVLISITITDTMTNTSTTLSAPSISLTPSGVACQNSPSTNSLSPISNNSGWYNTPWLAYTINLKPYLNKQFRIEATAMGCAFGGHGGYLYFDAKCGNIPIATDVFNPQSSDTIRITSCVYPSTLAIPSSFQVNNPSVFYFNPPVFTAFQYGTEIYTFTLFPGASLPSYTKTLILNVDLANLIISPNTSQICMGESIKLTASGSDGYNWSTGDTTASIIVSPTVITTYTATSIDTNGCRKNSNKVLDVSICMGITVLAADREILVYPNPNTGEFYLDLEDQKSELFMQNSAGQIVYKQNVYKGQNSIQTKLTPGIYYYQIKDKDLLLHGKLSIE